MLNLLSSVKIIFFYKSFFLLLTHIFKNRGFECRFLLYERNLKVLDLGRRSIFTFLCCHFDKALYERIFSSSKRCNWKYFSYWKFSWMKEREIKHKLLVKMEKNAFITICITHLIYYTQKLPHHFETFWICFYL